MSKMSLPRQPFTLAYGESYADAESSNTSLQELLAHCFRQLAGIARDDAGQCLAHLHIIQASAVTREGEDENSTV